MSWQALSFDIGTRFDVFRSTDGGITFETTPCGSTSYSAPGTCSIVDVGVTRNYRYSYRVLDSEGGDYWYMAAPFQGSLSSLPLPPEPTSAPTFIVKDLWTDETSTSVQVHITQGMAWAQTYTLSYYSDQDPTPTTVTLYGRDAMTLGVSPQPALMPLRNYHIKIRANGMTTSTSYGPERHFQIIPAPDLYYAGVVGGTEIFLTWTSVPQSAGYVVQYGRTDVGSVTTVDTSTLTLWRLGGLDQNAEYVMQVAAKDAWSNISTLSAPVTLFTGTASPTSLGEEGTGVSLKLHASPNPLPLGGSTALNFAVEGSRELALRIFDTSGRLVRELYRGQASAGRHAVRWDGKDGAGRGVASGVYHIVLDVPGQGQQTTKVVIWR